MKNLKTKIIASAAATLALVGVGIAGPAQAKCVTSGSGQICTEVGAVRHVYAFAGATRYDNAAAVAAFNFEPWGSVVYVVNGTAYADAAVAAGAASRYPGPVLYTAQNDVPDVTMNAIRALDPDTVVVIGGSSVVGQNALTELSW